MNGPKTAIVISASSDIGTAACKRWLAFGWRIFGTYRTYSTAIEALQRQGANLVQCDLSIRYSVQNACNKLCELCPRWDLLVLAPGSLEPIGPFTECDFEEWEKSIQVNFTAQLRIVRELLPARSLSDRLEPCVLFFAGGGTNSATTNYSAYTVSKIALIKMCELLDAEIPDTRFVILGPGWVKTKIHESTLAAGAAAGANYEHTRAKLVSDECVPVAVVLDCIDWIFKAPHDVIGGRNISLVYDDWGNPALDEMLRHDPDMYKLRRLGNDRLVRISPVSEGPYRESN